MRPIKHLLVGSLLLFLAFVAGLYPDWPTTALGIEPAPEMAELFQAARGGDAFYQPDKSELAQARRLFGELFQGHYQDRNRLRSEWGRLGFRLVFSHLLGQPYLAVMEDTDKGGRGFYLFCPGSDSQAALMMPHSMKDLSTGRIGLELLKQERFVGAAFNTMPRYRQQNKETVRADLAHAANTYFVAFTRAFADQFPAGRLAQIHGFAAEKRTTPAGRQAEIIVSSGSLVLGPEIMKFADCLRQSTPFQIALYPLEVGELGGTTNISANILQRMGHGGFIHIEMAYSVREQLLAKPDLLERLGNCLAPAS